MSALAPTSLEVVELEEALDLNPRCDVCDTQPAWMATSDCCKVIHLLCESHRAAVDRLWARSILVKHVSCDGFVTSIAWEPYRKGDR